MKSQSMVNSDYFISNAFDLHMGVGIIRIQHGFDASLFSEDDTRNNCAETPEPQLRRNRSYSQMSQGKDIKKYISIKCSLIRF